MMKVLFCLALLVAMAMADYPEEENSDPSLFAGDMRLNNEQKLIIAMGGDISKGSKAKGPKGRSIMSNTKILWYPNRMVHYNITPDLEAIPVATMGIMKAFREWEERSCLSFHRRTTEKDFIEMFQGSGCWSYVGRQGGMQQVSLKDGCWGAGTIVHELGHAVGFGHEQNRPDRDQYIKVRFENVPLEKQHNFQKYSHSEVDSLGSPYDYRSFMQYSMKSFGIDDKITLDPIQEGVFQLGQRVGFTKEDQFQADGLYRCNGTTTRPTPTFTEFKLTGPNDCTFENGMCHFKQDSNDDFDWTRRIGGTPSGNTGPEVDHTTSRIGTFLYIEASSPQKKGDVARLYTKKFPASPKICVSFWLHMYSYNASMMGSFDVKMKNTQTSCETSLKEFKGSTGVNAWQEVQINYNADSEHQLVFEAVRGSGYQGDVSIDDVSFYEGTCRPESPKPKPVVHAGPCSDTADREAQYCGQWKQAGFCAAHESYMRRFCSKTCKFC